MATLQVTLPTLHWAQRQIRQYPSRFRVVAAGRRFGKSRLAGACVLESALKGGTAWWVAPTYQTGLIGWRSVLALSKQIPNVIVHKSIMAIEYPNGGIFQVRTGANPDALRGEGLDFVVLDECAFMQVEVWTEVLRPALSDKLGRAIFISTPKGHNWFFELFARGKDALQPDWSAFNFPSLANPYFPRSEMQAAAMELPERVFEQEYLAMFKEGSGSVFRDVAEVSILEKEAGPTEGHSYVMGIDWGKEHDFSVISVIDTTTNKQVDLDRFNKIGWIVQRNRVADMYRKWRPFSVWAEENSIGGPNVDQLNADGIPVNAFSMSGSSKPPLIDALALATERRDLTLLNDPQQKLEMQAYTYVHSAGGGFKYSAPNGYHDDTVVALAIAWHGATHAQPFIMI